VSISIEAADLLQSCQ